MVWVLNNGGGYFPIPMKRFVALLSNSNDERLITREVCWNMYPVGYMRTDDIRSTCVQTGLMQYTVFTFGGSR